MHASASAQACKKNLISLIPYLQLRVGALYAPMVSQATPFNLPERLKSVTCETNAQEFVEDEETLKHQAQLRGLPYDSCLLREDTVDITPDRTISVAPGEGQKPICIFTDQHFEKMCNPTKYPTSKCDLITERKTKLTTRLTRDSLMQTGDLSWILSTCCLRSMQWRVSKLPMMPALHSDKPKEDCTEDRCSLLELQEPASRE